MLPFKRIAFASLVAPAAVAGPLFVIAALSWAFMNPISDGDAPFRLAGLGMLAAIPVYLALAVVCTVVAFILQRLGMLSRWSLLAVGAIAAVAMAAWLALPWAREGNSSQAVQSFALFFAIAFAAAGALSFTWWWVASNMPSERTGTLFYFSGHSDLTEGVIDGDARATNGRSLRS